VFGIDRVSSECMYLIPGYLTWFVDGLVGLWCFRMEVFSLAVPANFYPPSRGNPNCRFGSPSGKTPSNGVKFTVASE